MELSEKQAEAVKVATTNRRAIITGGAGSGKTTVIRQIVEALGEQGEVVVLCAPTGKAAKRVTEATGFRAVTIHSACGIFPVDGDDEVGSSDRPPAVASATTVIVDEASMTDDQILAALCSRIQANCRLVLVGDPNQLPPVGCGYPFRDLIRSGKVPHVHLDKVHRQAGKLLENCYSILQGDADVVVYDAGKGNRADADWSFIECGDDAIVASLTALFAVGKCEETFGIPAEELLVLTPINKGPHGRIQLNRAIQNVYHTTRGRVAPTYKGAEEGIDQFVIGDRVIWTKNDKTLGLVNGDTGIVRAVGVDKVVVDWDGIGQKTVDTGITLQLAWVLTCHKAQGSQYAKILVIQSGKHGGGYLDKIINRSWVYTAATRSQRSTYFLGSAKAFRKHVATPAVDTRQTYLTTLLA